MSKAQVRPRSRRPLRERLRVAQVLVDVLDLVSDEEAPPPSVVELDVDDNVRLPEHYDDGPFAVPEIRGDPDLTEADEEDTIEMSRSTLFGE